MLPSESEGSLSTNRWSENPGAGHDGIEWMALQALSSLKISLDISVYFGALEDDAADDTDATKM